MDNFWEFRAELRSIAEYFTTVDSLSTKRNLQCKLKPNVT